MHGADHERCRHPHPSLPQAPRGGEGGGWAGVELVLWKGAVWLSDPRPAARGPAAACQGPELWGECPLKGFRCVPFGGRGASHVPAESWGAPSGQFGLQERIAEGLGMESPRPWVCSLPWVPDSLHEVSQGGFGFRSVATGPNIKAQHASGRSWAVHVRGAGRGPGHCVSEQTGGQGEHPCFFVPGGIQPLACYSHPGRETGQFLFAAADAHLTQLIPHLQTKVGPSDPATEDSGPTPPSSIRMVPRARGLHCPELSSCSRK